MGRALDSIGVALCLFDDADRTMLWNATFLRFFPEHAGHVHVGESYWANLGRFYESRLPPAERHSIERYIEDGIRRHRAQSRPFVFQHRGRLLRVASLPMPDNGRVRMWTTLTDPESQAPAGGPLHGHIPLEDLFANLADGAMVLDPSGGIIAVNQEFLALYDAASPADVQGLTFPQVVGRAWIEATGEATRVTERLAAFIDNARFAGAPFEVELPGSRWRRVLERRMPDSTAYLSHADITELKRQQQALSEAERQARDGEERFRLIAENSGDIIVSLGHDGKMHFVSPSITPVLGWMPRDVSGGLIDMLICSEDLRQFRNAVLGGDRGPDVAQADDQQNVLTCRLRHRQGGLVWMEAHARSVKVSPSQPIRAVCSLRDITKRVAAETALREAYRQLAVLAVTDALTGIANRRRFEDVLVRHGSAAAAVGEPLSLLLIDVDHFKGVNDVFGHQAGDRCLQMVAPIIEGIVPHEDNLVARFGGEEFAVVLPGMAAPGARSVADAIRAGIEADRGQDFNAATPVTVSIGVVSVVAQDGVWCGTDALISAADRALYRAKRSGRNQVAVA